MLFIDGLFRIPTAFRHSSLVPFPQASPITLYAVDSNVTSAIADGQQYLSAAGGGGMAPHSESPALGYLILLVFEAVLEVVCVSLPGYIIAKQGMFNPEMQKFVANLNVSLFTPCLIFTKLASQLTLSKIVELAVIPVIFVVMTLTSYLCSLLMCRIFRLGKRASNFVIAMGVFGNSNSLPISLVISLSMTIGGLHWDRIPDDNDEDVAARGILYLLIFQQLGQLVRWSWGYHVLLAPPGKYDELDDGTPAPAIVQEGRYRDEQQESGSEDDIENAQGVDPFETPQFQNSFVGLQYPYEASARDTDGLLKVDGHSRHHSRKSTGVNGYSETNSEYPTRVQSPTSPFERSSATSITTTSRPESQHGPLATPGPGPDGDLTSFPAPIALHVPISLKSKGPQSTLGKAWEKFRNGAVRAYATFMAVMNPPLWAMLCAVIVASIPKLQALFFTPGTFIQNSVTRAVSQTGNVAVPLILVVLGANLANNTTSSESANLRAKKHHNKLLVASIMSRMVLPFLITAPILAIAAKWLPISILDDPIFVIVCYLLMGAPSALQLAQICQINGVYESVMARILFWSYVVVILPSTVVLVVTAVEVVKWAA
ncbi:auxin efflux carrier [Terfezia claveryi]|nr:auxin efflux carrier [Terfezia claveryi]